jgi:hypothetical protein
MLAGFTKLTSIVEIERKPPLVWHDKIDTDESGESS